jgi:hypothetical protein
MRTPRKWSRGDTIFLLLVLLIGAALRFAPIGREALDGDEGFTLRVVSAPLSVAWEMIQRDLVHPPLFYLLVKAWTTIAGISALNLRLLSLVSGVGAVGLAFLLARRFPLRTPYCALAALLVAINDTHIYFSQQARSYSFFAALVLLFALAMLRVDAANRSSTPLRAWHWAMLTGLALLLCYTHYVGALYVIAAWLCVIASPRDRAFKLKVTTCFGIAALLFLPWLIGEIGVYKSKGLEENLGWEGLPGFYDLRAIFARAVGILEIAGGTSLALIILLVLSVAAMRRWDDEPSADSAPAATTTSARVAIVGRGWVPLSNITPWLLLSLTFVPPLLLFLAASRPLALPVFAYRHLVPSVLPAIVLITAGLAMLARRAGRAGIAVGLAGALLLVTLQAIPTGKNIGSPRRVPYDQIARLLNSEFAGLPAYTTYPYGIGAPVNFYAGGDRISTLPDHLDTNAPRIVLLFRPALPEEIGKVQSLIESGWIVERELYFTNAGESQYGTKLQVLGRRDAPTSLEGNPPLLLEPAREDLVGNAELDDELGAATDDIDAPAGRVVTVDGGPVNGG